MRRAPDWWWRWARSAPNPGASASWRAARSRISRKRAAKKKENFENRLTDDPEIKCYLPGVPRATYMPYPFQIVQTSKDILIAYEYAGAVRNIYMR